MISLLSSRNDLTAGVSHYSPERRLAACACLLAGLTTDDGMDSSNNQNQDSCIRDPMSPMLVYSLMRAQCHHHTHGGRRDEYSSKKTGPEGQPPWREMTAVLLLEHIPREMIFAIFSEKPQSEAFGLVTY